MRFTFGRRRALVCRDAVQLMTDYLDDVLAPADRARLEVHLAGCPNCSEYLAQLRITVAAAGRVEAEDLSAGALAELVDVYRRWTLE